MKLTLCYAPIACSLVPLINLNEVGALFEVREIDFRKGNNMTSDYLAIETRYGKIVAVLIVDGRALTENVAVEHLYRADLPRGQTVPVQVNGRTGSHFFDGLVQRRHSSASDPHLQSDKILRRTYNSEEATRTLAKKALKENFAAADKRLAGREFFFDHFTAPDAHFFWCTRRATQLDFKVDGYANVVGHHNRLHQRNSVKKALASRRRQWRNSRRREGNDYDKSPQKMSTTRSPRRQRCDAKEPSSPSIDSRVVS